WRRDPLAHGFSDAAGRGPTVGWDAAPARDRPSPDVRLDAAGISDHAARGGRRGAGRARRRCGHRDRTLGPTAAHIARGRGAWGWLRYQPTSALSHWYRERFGRGRRLRRIGIVALARKLLIAWWRYGETGIVPEGAVLKA